eukprot:scaffold11490_cov135-Isochrysis_galbana.AAC.1
MFATVHAAGSSLLGLFTSCATFDSTIHDHPSSRLDLEGEKEAPTCLLNSQPRCPLYTQPQLTVVP